MDEIGISLIIYWYEKTTINFILIYLTNLIKIKCNEIHYYE